MVTAGPTYEKIDPVRYIGNYSSGRMGYSIAEACAARGADVMLVSGPVSISITHPGISIIPVNTAAEMFNECTRLFQDCDACIMAAAVADYTPAIKSNRKIKRKKGNLSLELVPTEDIAAALGRKKRKDQVLVGFALETDNEIKNATSKLKKKKMDFIVLNSLNDEGAGFGTDTNRITIIDKHNKSFKFELKTKKEVAEDIVNALERYLKI